MSLKHRILAAGYQPLRFRNALLRRAGLRPPGRLRVLLYHDVAPANESDFSAQMRWLARSWQFVSPELFSAMISGEESVREDSLLLTFDDGFTSNRRIVENVLNPMGIRALFFVISKFVELCTSDEQRAFVARHIYPDMDEAQVPAHWGSMKWNDLVYLLETGHSIGGHTSYHARLAQVSSIGLAAEIIDSANSLEERLSTRIDHFAYTFGNLSSFSPAALEVARSRFKYVYTGLRGDNARGVPPWAIRRDAMAATDSVSLLGALLEGGADLGYVGDLSKYESWARPT